MNKEQLLQLLQELKNNVNFQIMDENARYEAIENLSDEIRELENGKEYYILKQAVYSGDNYFVAAEVTEDGEDLKENFSILHESKENGESFIEFERDPKTIQILLKHLNIKEG